VTFVVALALSAAIAPPCTAARLAGTFAVVPGSPGAGNIVYALRLKNTSSAACTLTGIPDVTLLDRRGRKLPTHPFPAQPGALTAVLVTLAPGKSAKATARFSPDVPGPGEPAAGTKCERTAWWFRVLAQGGGTTKVKLGPPTPVCEHGQLLFSGYSIKS